MKQGMHQLRMSTNLSLLINGDRAVVRFHSILFLLAIVVIISYNSKLRFQRFGDVIVRGAKEESKVRFQKSISDFVHAASSDQGFDQAPFWPVQVFRQYKKWHSSHAINLDQGVGRKYAIVYYYCPNRAGNILHSMLATVAWAVIHNRTILWKYDTDFEEPNTPEDCEQVLKRAEWFGSFDEYSQLFNLSDPVPVPIDKKRGEYDRLHQTVIYPQIPDVQHLHLNIYRNGWRSDPSHEKGYVEYVLNLDVASRQRATRLFQEGVDFLYGFLFRELFTVQVPVNTSHDSSFSFSLALHSRHTVVGDDGSFIIDETRCLEDMLPSNRSSKDCAVYLISDRPKTTEKLSDWLEQRNCTPIVALRESVESEYSNEHGPFAGRGFIEDLQMASKARTGLIGDSHRSSFMLLAELVAFDRRIDDWRKGKLTQEKIMRCELPGRYGTGYSYGPGTPLFRSHRRAEPLKPVENIEKYKEWHSSTTLKDQPHDRKFVIVELSCTQTLEHNINQFLNSLLVAIITNRTILWKDVDMNSCSVVGNISNMCDRNGEANRYCKPLLMPASWIPLYRVWSQELEISPSIHLSSSFNDNLLLISDKINSFQAITISDHPSRYFFNIKDDRWNTTLAWELYNEGINFLYGMLFDHSLTFAKVITVVDESPKPLASQGASVALWTRNNKVDINQWDVTKESCCLSSVLFNYSSPCYIFQSTDQDETTPVLKKWLVERNCSTIGPNPKKLAISELSNSTASSLVQLLRDFFFISKHARTAFVGQSDGGFANLLVDRIEYNRRLESWKLGRIPPILGDLIICNPAACIPVRQ